MKSDPYSGPAVSFIESVRPRFDGSPAAFAPRPKIDHIKSDLEEVREALYTAGYAEEVAAIDAYMAECRACADAVLDGGEVPPSAIAARIEMVRVLKARLA